MLPLSWLLILLLLVALWATFTYRRLVRLERASSLAFEQVLAQLGRRCELMPSLTEQAHQSLAHEPQVLGAMAPACEQANKQQRSASISGPVADSVSALTVAEQVLAGALTRLFSLAQSYPEVLDHSRLRALSTQIGLIEKQIELERQTYNDQALEYNDARSQLPVCWLARLLGFQPHAVLASTHSQTEQFCGATSP